LKPFLSGLRRHQNSHLGDPKGGNTKQRSLFLEKGLFWFISEDFAIFGCHMTNSSSVCLAHLPSEEYTKTSNSGGP